MPRVPTTKQRLIIDVKRVKVPLHKLLHKQDFYKGLEALTEVKAALLEEEFLFNAQIRFDVTQAGVSLVAGLVESNEAYILRQEQVLQQEQERTERAARTAERKELTAAKFAEREKMLAQREAADQFRLFATEKILTKEEAIALVIQSYDS